MQNRFEYFREFILEVLEQKDATAPPKLSSELTQVFLVCDKRDLAFAKQVRDSFMNRGFEIELPLFEGTPAELRQDLVESMQSAQVTAILWKESSEAWVRQMLRQWKIVKMSTPDTPRALIVYIPEELTPAQKVFEGYEAVVLRNASLSQFAASVKEVGGAALE